LTPENAKTQSWVTNCLAANSRSTGPQQQNTDDNCPVDTAWRTVANMTKGMSAYVSEKRTKCGENLVHWIS